MSAGLRILEWVKRRHRAGGNWLASALLAGWKVLRRLPGAQHVRLPLACHGHRLWIRPFSYDDLLVITPDYERSVVSIQPRRGGVAVDAGAFIGRHTLTYARAVGREGRVVAIEPLESNFRLLRRNIAANGCDQVTCVRCALGPAEGSAVLWFDRDTSTASQFRELGQKCVVAQRRLDTVLGELGIGQIDLLKIDVEGAELGVLEGGQETLARSPAAVLVIEVHDPGSGETSGESAIRRWLDGRGYQMEEIEERGRYFLVARQHGADQEDEQQGAREMPERAAPHRNAAAVT